MGLLNFGDLHVLVNAENGVTNRGAFGCRRVTRHDTEFSIIPFALHFVGVAVAPGAGHREQAGRDEFIQTDTMGVEREVPALRLSNLEKISADTREADGLRRGRAGVGRGHFLRGEIENSKRHGNKDENANELAHVGSVNRANREGKILGRKEF